MIHDDEIREVLAISDQVAATRVRRFSMYVELALIALITLATVLELISRTVACGLLIGLFLTGITVFACAMPIANLLAIRGERTVAAPFASESHGTGYGLLGLSMAYGAAFLMCLDFWFAQQIQIFFARVFPSPEDALIDRKADLIFYCVSAFVTATIFVLIFRLRFPTRAQVTVPKVAFELRISLPCFQAIRLARFRAFESGGTCVEPFDLLMGLLALENEVPATALRVCDVLPVMLERAAERIPALESDSAEPSAQPEMQHTQTYSGTAIALPLSAASKRIVASFRELPQSQPIAPIDLFYLLLKDERNIRIFEELGIDHERVRQLCG